MGMGSYLLRNYVRTPLFRIPLRIGLNCGTGSALLNDGGEVLPCYRHEGHSSSVRYIQACHSQAER